MVTTRNPTNGSAHPRKRKLDDYSVRTIRRTKGMVTAIARELGTSHAYVSMVVAGKKNVTPRFLDALAKILLEDAKDRTATAFTARYYG